MYTEIKVESASVIGYKPRSCELAESSSSLTVPASVIC